MIDVAHLVAEIGGMYPNWGGEYAAPSPYASEMTRWTPMMRKAQP